MKEVGTVVFTPLDAFIVVEHRRGFAVLELIEDGTGIGLGDKLWARDWTGPPFASHPTYRMIEKDNVLHSVSTWWNTTSFDEAVSQAEGLARSATGEPG
jgi:hypothetical protein